jgi:hypothetical protein
MLGAAVPVGVAICKPSNGLHEVRMAAKIHAAINHFTQSKIFASMLMT